MFFTEGPKDLGMIPQVFTVAPKGCSPAYAWAIMKRRYGADFLVNNKPHQKLGWYILIGELVVFFLNGHINIHVQNK